MDAASRRELDALRRRAWGAGGGLDDDPAAQARLAELEAESRAESPGGPPTPDVTAVTAAPGMPDPPTVDAEAVTLFTVPLDGRLSDITGNTATLIPPALPDDRDSEWITPAGRYYSGQLWRRRADTDELCLVVELAAGTRGTCLPEEAHRRNALLVVIPASDIPIDARPEGMTETDAVGFWWRADDNVEVVLAPLPAAAP